MKSLFTPLLSEGLTTLKIRYDWKSGQSFLFAAKLWEKDFDFSNYNKTFYVDSVMTKTAKFLNDEEVRALYKKYDLEDYLEEVIGLLRKGKHFGMECVFNEKFNIRFIGNMHSRTLGVNNRYHATMLGGIRRHGFEDEEIDVIIDGLNLSRAMSFKNIAAEINFGGSKTTVHMDPIDLENMEMMGFIAYSQDSMRAATGPDMNFPTAMADVMNKHFSMYFNGGPNSKLGETGKPTAYGVYLALRQAVRFKTGNDSIEGMTAAVQGLGAVGKYMAEHLLEGGIKKLYVTDMNKERALDFIKENSSKDIEYVDPSEILEVKVDILSPNAIGGIIHEGNIDKFNCEIIFGGANNQLRASSQEEEIRLARLLEKRGILFQEAWWHNSAGVLAGHEEYIERENASLEVLNAKIERIVPTKTWENLNKAKELGITPTECMYKTCEAIVYKQ